MDYYCINLRTRPDRRAYMEKEFKSLGINPIWCTYDKHPDGGIIGNFEGHTDIWKYALNRQAEWICIFEDDVHTDDPELFHDTINRRAEFLCDAERESFDVGQIAARTSFDVLYLNPCIIRQRNTYPDGFFSGSFYCIGCYLIRKDHLQKVLDHCMPYKGLTLDVAMIGLKCVGRKVFNQIDSVSDIKHNVPQDSLKYEWLMKIYPIGYITEQSIIICRRIPFFRNIL